MGSIDADAHVIESEATFRFLDPQYKHLEPIPITRKESDAAEYAVDGRKLNEYWVIDGRLQPRQFNLGVNTTPKESREMTDVQARLSHMDELGIDIQVLYPTLYLRAFTEDPTVEYALTKCYNRWIADVSRQAPDRLRWALIAPLLSPHRLREEMEFCKENGACAVFLRALEYDQRVGANSSTSSTGWARNWTCRCASIPASTACTSTICSPRRAASRGPSCPPSAPSTA